ncbi:MAG: hypothetical protein RXO22_07685 [Thermocladium sp.]|jgi:hypothetical protein
MDSKDLIASIFGVILLIIVAIGASKLIGDNPISIIIIIAVIEVMFGLMIGYLLLGRLAGLSTRIKELTLKYRLLIGHGLFLGHSNKELMSDLTLIDYFMKHYYNGLQYKLELNGNDAILYASLDVDAGMRLINSLNNELSVIRINEYKKIG